mmetsp:Transcript_5696/g.11660  ORF Transcript_5696/g.11660 Transcript_5696/m.11660 type:complete len:453 (+) Transcript_5696:93-1451(+)
MSLSIHQQRRVFLGPPDIGCLLRIIQDANINKKNSIKPGNLVSFGKPPGYDIKSIRKDYHKPMIVEELNDREIVAVAIGGDCYFALSSGGEVLCFGDKYLKKYFSRPDHDFVPLLNISEFYPSVYGPNGDKFMTDDHGDIIPFFERETGSIRAIDSSESHFLALSQLGDVYMLGNEGIVPTPPIDDIRNPRGLRPRKSCYVWPVHIYQLPNRAIDISAGGTFSAAILEDNTLYTWGWFTRCQAINVKNGKKTEFLPKPEPVRWTRPLFKRIVLGVSCGWNHMLVLAHDETRNGVSTYSCGQNDFGQLGHGDQENRNELEEIKALQQDDIITVEAGWKKSLFLESSGKKLYGCGMNMQNNLDHSTIPIRLHLVEGGIAEKDQPKICQFSVYKQILVLTESGEIYSWGPNKWGVCGHEADNMNHRPFRTKPTKIDTTHKFKLVVAGKGVSLGIV